MDGDKARCDALAAASTPLPAFGPEFASAVDRFADRRVVLLGESSHGTEEFYRARAAWTERLVAQHGFTVVALEADWPDTARLDAAVRGRAPAKDATAPFQRFPTWMWRNRAVADMVERLRAVNAGRPAARQAGVYGLDLYSLPSSMDAVVDFVARHDPAALEEVRRRYGCLTPYRANPARYGMLSDRPGFNPCTADVAAVVERVMAERVGLIRAHDEGLFSALQNARVVAASEAYYRAMYEGSAASWNLRDRHMFDTLRAVLDARGPGTKAVVWAHNSHIGDASATGMGTMGETNLGELCREAFGADAALVGFSTDRGTVRAASDWEGPDEVKRVLPALQGSWEALLREAVPPRALVEVARADVREALAAPRLQRFIGVVYRPGTERQSHYLDATLSDQFDALVWFEETQAVEPLAAEPVAGEAATAPFGV